MHVMLFYPVLDNYYIATETEVMAWILGSIARLTQYYFPINLRF